MPPFALTDAVPFEPPKQVTLVPPGTALRRVGSVMVTGVVTPIEPLASVTVSW